MDSVLLISKTLAIIAVGTVLSKSFGRWFRDTIIIPKFTVDKDIPNLGKARSGGRLPGQAVVCGGSIAGILAAAVLSDHYENVLIVEPEAWVSTDDGVTLQNPRETRLNEGGGHIEVVNKRTRVMQTTSAHGYLPALSPIIFQLFPNFTQAVDELGLSSRFGESNYDPSMSGVPSPPRPAGYKTILTVFVRRETLEKLLRRCLLKSRTNVCQIVGTVTGVIRSPKDASILSQVSIRTPDGSQVTQDAAFVADATGPTQGGLKWLQKLGLTLPPSMRIQYTPNVDYTTMSFVVPPHIQAKLPIPGGWNADRFIYWYVPNTAIERVSIIFTVLENNILMVWFGGWDIDVPPRSIPEFKAVVQTLVHGAHPVPQHVFEILDILQDHIEEIDPAFVLRKLPPSAYTFYHKFSNTAGFPANFVALGDAVMVVNPFFGQGCAKAGIGAATLDHELRISDPRTDQRFSTKFFQRQADRLQHAWNMTKDIDYGFKSTIPVQGETHAAGSFGRWFASQIFKMAPNDPALFWTLWDINYFLLPPTDLMTPPIFVRAVWTWLTT